MLSRVYEAWTALLRRLWRLRALGPEYASLELDGSHNRLAPVASICRLRTTLAGKVSATLRPEDQDHLREWRSWVEEA